jgi:hypothetical protein
MTLIREHDPFSGHREPVSFEDAIAETFPDGVPPLEPTEYANTPVVTEPLAAGSPAEVVEEKPPAKPVTRRRPRRAKTAPVKR